MLNVDLLDRTMAMIETLPKETLANFGRRDSWDQVDFGHLGSRRSGFLWRQHTTTFTGCFGGWAYYLATGEVVRTTVDSLADNHLPNRWAKCAAVLGLNTVESVLLFEGHNTKADLRRYVQLIKARHALHDKPAPPPVLRRVWAATPAAQDRELALV